MFTNDAPVGYPAQYHTGCMAIIDVQTGTCVAEISVAAMQRAAASNPISQVIAVHDVQDEADWDRLGSGGSIDMAVIGAGNAP
jgi:hypothetical protein